MYTDRRLSLKTNLATCLYWADRLGLKPNGLCRDLKGIPEALRLLLGARPIGSRGVLQEMSGGGLWDGRKRNRNPVVASKGGVALA